MRPEVTFARLRYSLGGARPSQAAHLAVSPPPIQTFGVRIPSYQGWYPNVGSTYAKAHASMPPTYPVHDRTKSSTRLQ